MKTDNVRIADLRPDDAEKVNEVVTLLMDAFEQSPDYCSDRESALEEVEEQFDPGCISRVAVDEQGKVRLSRKAVIMESPDYDPADYEGKDYDGPPPSGGRRDRDGGSGRGRDRRRGGRSRSGRDRR